MEVSLTIPDEDVAKFKERFGEKNWQSAMVGCLHGWLIRIESAERRLSLPDDLDLDAS
jgi:hypothetical protein